MVENVLLFMSVSIVYMEVSPETGFKFFLPLGNLSLGNRKHENDPNPQGAQPKLVSPRGRFGEKA